MLYTIPGVTPGALSDSAPPLGFHYHSCHDPNHLLHHLTVHLHPVKHFLLKAYQMRPGQWDEGGES